MIGAPKSQEDMPMLVKRSLVSQTLQRTWFQEHLEGLCAYYVNPANNKGMASAPSCQLR